MKEWAWVLILMALLGKLIRTLLPKGEKSPLYSPLRFLLSLCLIVVIFSPWIKLMRGELSFSFPKIESETPPDGDRLILEKMGSTMGASLRTAFPEEEFSLEIYCDESSVPILVSVSASSTEMAEEICAFIERNYRLQAEIKEGGG